MNRSIAFLSTLLCVSLMYGTQSIQCDSLLTCVLDSNLSRCPDRCFGKTFFSIRPQDSNSARRLFKIAQEEGHAEYHDCVGWGFNFSVGTEQTFFRSGDALGKWFLFNGKQCIIVTRLVLLNLLVNQALQQAVPTVGGSVNVSSTTSILVLRHVVNIGGAGFTVVFPPAPINGQFFTIMCGTTNSVVLNNNGNGASVVNPVTTLNPGSNFTASTNGTSVTYLYFAATNTWYRYGRG